MSATIAVLGNHMVSFTTESELVWSLEHLGHKVVKFQESCDTTDKIIDVCRAEKVQLLIYIHTHGWGITGTRTVEEMITLLRAEGVKTCSFHLDRFWSIPNREARIGNEPFWKTDVCFTADGGNQEGFAAKGVNHVWLPPAVVERGVHFGSPNAELDVIFTGSVNYHPEYPFRPQMAATLRNHYGARFQVFQGVREERLNNLYASAKVCVGDHIFAGCPRYWSDRLPETIGRGGFIIYPRTEGIDIPGLVTYTPQDTKDLIDKVDYFLDPAHEDERKERLVSAHEWVKKYDTYTQRMAFLVERMGGIYF